MDIIPSSTTSFEQFVVDYIKDLKISGLSELAKVLERIDRSLASQRPKYLRIIKLKPRSILTSIGMLSFKRRYYYDEINHCYLYLLDAFLAIPKRNKLMHDVKIKLIEAASEMSYAKAGRYGSSEDYPVSKSTVYRLIRDSKYIIEDRYALLNNEAAIHVQLDEKFVHVKENKHKKKLYTCTIFKGIRHHGEKRVLQNRTLLANVNLSLLLKRLNLVLKDKYKVSLDDEVYISGDLASYIQHAPDKILVCKARYVPDKYHIKAALKKSLGLVASDEELNDKDYQETLIKALEGLACDNDARKIKTMLKRNPQCLKVYLNADYEGCSQECMNSHYYCPRFDKIPNVFRLKTLDRLADVINARENGYRLKLGFKRDLYDLPNFELGGLIIEKGRYDIDKTEMGYRTRKLFNSIEYGKWDW